MEKKLPTKNTLQDICFTFLIFSALIFLFSRTVADPDLWGHLRFGLDVIQSGELPRSDPYSFVTSGATWINHEWLTEVILGLTWTAAGTTGLILLKLTIGMGTIGIIFTHLRRVGFQPLRAGILILIVALSAWPSLLTVRPHIFTNLCFAITLWVVYLAENGQYRLLWILPLVFALWGNLHGGVLLGIGTIGLWTIFHLILNINSIKLILTPILVSIAATLLNPFGAMLPIFLLQTATRTRPEITEWNPINILSFQGFFFLLLFFPSFLALIYSNRQRKFVLVLLYFCIAILPFISLRHTVLSVMGIVILTSEHFLDLFENLKPNRSYSQNQIGRPTFSLLSFAIASSLIFMSLRYCKQINIVQNFYPVGAVALLKESGVSGNIANTFNVGEYIIWHLSPEIKVMIDGRRETIYNQEIYQKILNFEFGNKGWDEVLDSYQVEIALVQHSMATYNLFLLKPDWLLVYQDMHSALFVKQNSKYLYQLQKVASNFQPPAHPIYFPTEQ